MTHPSNTANGSSNNNVTGYGYSTRNRLCFDGDEAKYELFEVKFLGHLRLQKLLDELNKETPDVERNACIFAELVQVLDDKSLSLIIRDAKDDGKKSINILREHYLGRSKPRIISLYGELASLKMCPTETTTDYVIRAETAATSLKTAGEVISDSLLMAMCLKGLPNKYNSFATVITQKDDKIDFVKFKSALRSFEESENSRFNNNSNDDNIMQASSNIITCFKCGKPGHKSFECRNKGNSSQNNSNVKYNRYKNSRWCTNCNAASHDTKYCRKNTAKVVSQNCERDGNNDHSFAFKTVVANKENYQCLEKLNECMLVDCGATSHIICDESKFSSFDQNFDSSSHFIELADNSRSNNVVKGKGVAKMHIYDSNGDKCDFILNNALYVPSYKQNIFSVQAATENGASINFAPNDAKLCTVDGTIFDIEQKGRLYYLNNVKSSTIISRPLSEWHEVLGHSNVQDILKLENCVEGMKITDKCAAKNFKCDVCMKGKMTQYRERTADKKAESPLELVHTDLAGPITPMGREGFNYAINFIDDYSGATYVYFLKGKDDTPRAFQQFISDSAPYGIIKRIRSDNGKEYVSQEFQNIVLDNKIKHEFSAPYSAHQNGTSERAWRTLFEMGRCLLLESGLPKNLWTYAVRAAAFTRNRCYNPRTGKTPFEMLTGCKPNINKLEIFGSKCFAYIQKKKKLDDRSQEGKFVGFDNKSPAYLVYFPSENKVSRVRCVNFSASQNIPCEMNEDDYLFYPREIASNKNVSKNDLQAKNNDKPETKTDDSKLSLDNNTDDDCNKKTRFSTRERKKPEYLDAYETEYDDYSDCLSKMNHTSIHYCYKMAAIPNTFQEAMSSPDSHRWKSAMDEEVSTLQENNTYTLIKLPKDKSVIGGRWVFDVKPGINNEPKYKARYVAKGFSQIKDRDYDETFAPTARLTSIRMILQIAANHNMVIHQMDFKSAYLNSDIDFDLYVKQPEGYVLFDENDKPLVCKLNKSLYGLKQSGRNWNALLDSFLKHNNFIQSMSDPCLYTRIVDSSTHTFYLYG